jgi:DNA replication and repair protein RecF
MILEKLRLKYFKNYSDCSFNFNPKFNFIFGDNGNGKTNILEAVSFLCYTKSFLQSSESDCVKYGEDKLEVTGEFTNALSLKNKVLFIYDKPSSKKTVALNNEPVSRQSSFFGKIPLVVLSPGDIKLTTGSPNDRRRSFDILISQISRLYFDDLKSYNRVIRQKNSLLKENFVFKKYSREKLREMVDLWNDELIQYGVNIVLKRVEIAKEFRKYLEKHFRSIVGDSYVPMINYESELLNPEFIDDSDENILTENFKNILAEKYPLEIKRGVSLAGPQRDNYAFAMRKNGDVFNLKSFASQGEHKTFLVAFRLSEYIFLNDKLEGSNSGEPVLMLDDVFSELDKNRIEKISSLLPNFNQVFVTTTDKVYLNTIKKYFPDNDISVFNIVNGSVKANN